MTYDETIDGPRDCERHCRLTHDCHSFKYCPCEKKCHLYKKWITKDEPTKNEDDCYTTYMVQDDRNCKSNTFHYLLQF